MKKNWLCFAAALTLSWSQSAGAQAPGAPPAPLPAPQMAPAPTAAPAPVPEPVIPVPAQQAPAQVLHARGPAAVPSAPRQNCDSCGKHCFDPCSIKMPCFNPCNICDGHVFKGLLDHVKLPCGDWYAGVGVYYMAPAFETNPGFAVATGGSVTQHDLHHDFEVAPLAFVGWTGASGFGIRGRWFMFDGDGDVSALVTGAGTILAPDGTVPTVAAGDTIRATSNLKVNVVDLEGTYVFNAGNWALMSSAGLRYAHMSQDYLLQNTTAAGATTSLASASHNFNGAGPTFALEGRRPICGSCFALYGSARASVLAGSSNATAFNGTSQSTAQNDVDILSITELEVGGEWSRMLGRCRISAQLGLVGQAWLGGGYASQPLVDIRDTGSNFGFIGGVARVGFNF